MVSVTLGAERSLAPDLHCLQGLLGGGGSYQSGGQETHTSGVIRTLKDWPS